MRAAWIRASRASSTSRRRAPASAHRNLDLAMHVLRKDDQLKFVICDRADYEWSRARVQQERTRRPLPGAVLPELPTARRRAQLADWILADRLPVRFQVQLHKVLWGDVRPDAESEPLPGSPAVVLVSGGLDSATTLAMAHARGLSAAMRSRSTTVSATPWNSPPRDAVATALGAVEHRVLAMPIGQFGHSALTDPAIAVPESADQGIPVTYVPARNTFSSPARSAWAEVIGAQHIYIGVNAVDYSGYPDCRPAFIRAFEDLANLATRAGVEGRRRLHPRAADRAAARPRSSGAASRSASTTA